MWAVGDMVVTDRFLLRVDTNNVVSPGADEFVVFDVSDPASPTIVNSIGIGTDPVSLYVSGKYAYVVDQGSDD